MAPIRELDCRSPNYRREIDRGSVARLPKAHSVVNTSVREPSVTWSLGTNAVPAFRASLPVMHRALPLGDAR